MIELDFLKSLDITNVIPEKIVSNFLEKESKVLYLGESNYFDENEVFSECKKIEPEKIIELGKIEEKFDYVIFTEILETVDNPQDLILNVKNIGKTIIIYEYKFDEGCYNNDEWKRPWTKVGLEYFLGKEFDYINNIFLGYATIHICKFPYDKSLDKNRIEEYAIR